MVSKGSIWMIEKDLCRCCHSEGGFFNLATPNTFKEKQEIYCDMMRTCFEIEIDPVPGNLCVPTYTICSKCVDKLRKATTFKEQVLKCEEKFYKLLSSSSIAVPQIKEEFDIDIEVSDYNEDMGNDISDEDDDEDSTLAKSEIDLKTEPEEKNVEQVQKRNNLRPRASKTKDEAATQPTSKVKPKAKPKPKPKAPKEKVKKEETTEKKGTKPKFHLRPDDYTSNAGAYTCTRCEVSYTALQSLRYHIRSKHYKLPKYKCPLCDRDFMTLPPFVVHKLNEHNLDDRYECTACQTKFNAPSQLRKHINSYHMLGEKYRCDSCDYETFSFETLYKHKFKHKTVKDYHCRFCKKAFLRKATLELHERIHTGDRRKVCKICGQAFVQKASLNYHMTKYHPNVNF